MNTLIVYYSLEGNTDFVAKKIADKLQADILRLVPVKKYPEKGLAKFFWGGKSAMMAETPELEPYSWLYKSKSYKIFSIFIPVFALILGSVFNGFILSATAWY